MMDHEEYPHISWDTFNYCNQPNKSRAFEDMTRRLFILHFLKNSAIPHSDPSTPGVEVLPILEPIRLDGKPQKRISFQAKYFEQSSPDYKQIKDSAEQAVKHFKGKLDLVYLFCNRTLNTTNRSYKKIKEILSNVNIELVPISDYELLDLVFQYDSIYNYYFFPKRQELQSLNQYTGIPISAISHPDIVPDDSNSDNFNSVFTSLIEEKINYCCSLILSLKMDSVEKELKQLTSSNIDNWEYKEKIDFYNGLLQLYRNSNNGNNFDSLSVEYKEELIWLSNYYQYSINISPTEFSNRLPEVQVLIIDKLFTSGNWVGLTDLYKALTDSNNIKQEVRYQFDLHYALSSINLEMFDESIQKLQNLYEISPDDRLSLFMTIAEIGKVNCDFRNGSNADRNKLITLLSDLDKYGNVREYHINELLIKAIKLESLYFLGLSEKIYIEKAIEEFLICPISIQNNQFVKLFYAMCLELNGDRAKAIDIYSELDWKTEELFAARYMMALILDNQPENVKQIYMNLSNDSLSSRTKGIYLFALYQLHDDDFVKYLETIIQAYSNNIEALIDISFFTENSLIAQNKILPIIQEVIEDGKANEISLSKKYELLSFLAQCKAATLLEKVLSSLSNLSIINEQTIMEIYESLYQIIDEENETSGEHNRLLMSDDFESAERIADIFLQNSPSNQYFLHIKMLCAIARQMPFSSLKYAKELFDITRDEGMAHNVVALLINRNEMMPTEYKPYLNILMSTENPRYCITVAFAMQKLGKDTDVQYYAYKALYYLNGEDDYEVYEKFFILFNTFYSSEINKESQNLVRNNSVIYLQESSAPENSITVCLDSEADFCNDDNKSLNVIHISKNNPFYLRIRGTRIGDTIKLFNKTYRINRIIPRHLVALSYVMDKINKNPEKFYGTIVPVSAKNTQELIEKMKMLSDDEKQEKIILDFYHFENNEIGFPVDIFAPNDLGKLIGAVKYLLYEPDQAFYSGYYSVENTITRKYTLSLSTLMVLAIIDRLDILSTIKNRIILPSSIKNYLSDQYSKAIFFDKKSFGSMSIRAGKIHISAPDHTIPEILEKIIDFCNDVQTIDITDEERISLSFIKGMTAENLISGLKLNTIQLDFLVLAEKEKITYICDDLFFRKVCNVMGIRTINFASLLFNYPNKTYISSLVKELSTTNYIYTPIIANDDDEAIEIFRNLINGKKKFDFYMDLFKKMFNV